MLVNVNLVLVSGVKFVERKGYLTMVIEGAGVGRSYFRRTEAIRQWGHIIKVRCIPVSRVFNRGGTPFLVSPPPHIRAFPP